MDKRGAIMTPIDGKADSWEITSLFHFIWRLGLVLVTILSASRARAQETPPANVPALLAQLVDTPGHSERQRLAKKLARRKDIDLAAWKSAAERFRPLPTRQARGTLRTTAVDLEFPDGSLHKGDVDIWLPSRYDSAKPHPLILALHGTGGKGQGILGGWRDTAETAGAIVLAPTEPGPNRGFAATEAERQAVLAALRWARRHYNVDEDRILITGFSRGGHLSWDVASRHPDLFAAVVPMVGAPRFDLRRGANNFRYLENLVHTPIRDLQGAMDDPAMIWNLKEAEARMKSWGARDFELLIFPDRGHGVDWNAVDWPAFIDQVHRRPLAPEVIRRFASKGEGRAFWVEGLIPSSKVKVEFRPRVKAEAWNRLDQEGKKRFLIDAALRRTARIAAKRLQDGSFRVETYRVKRLRLLLPAAWIPPKGRVTVIKDGRRKTLTARFSKLVLLSEFAERFDRRFLPVAEVRL